MLCECSYFPLLTSHTQWGHGTDRSDNTEEHTVGPEGGEMTPAVWLCAQVPRVMREDKYGLQGASQHRSLPSTGFHPD